MPGTLSLMTVHMTLSLIPLAIIGLPLWGGSTLARG